MDFGKAFTYQFNDQDWITKILIAAIIPLIPIIGSLVVAGWGVEITKRTIRMESQPLADWNDFGGYLLKGIKVFLIALIYSLPIIIVSLGLTLLFLVPVDNNVEWIQSMAIIGSVCAGLIALIYMVLLVFVLPAAIARFAYTDQMGSAFRLRELTSLIRSAPVAWLMVFLGGIISGFISSLGSLACVIGVLPATAYTTSINAHLQGQAYLEAMNNPHPI